MQQERFAAGDLVGIPTLPRNDGSTVWHPDPSGTHIGIIVEMVEPARRGIYSLVGDCAVIKLASGELVTLSTNMIELIEKQTKQLSP